ncbi:MAG: zf-TFIIB domain-containing protein [Candidatus Omnitrophota bacterium]
MKCPVCNENLKTTICKNQELDTCPKCGGIWFDEGELYKVVESMISNNEVTPLTLEQSLRKKVISPQRIKQPILKCPRCHVDMRIYNYAYNSNVLLDQCPDCNGLWTDKGEIQTAAQYIKGNEKIESYAKALTELCPRYQKKRGKTDRVIASIIALFYLGGAYVHFGAEAFFRIFLFLILPLACIFFSETMGNMTGFIAKPCSPVITKPSPPFLIALLGWVLLLLPMVIGICWNLNGSFCQCR